jgi:asparagine synthase (glutamine-hydrolysing)
MIRALDVSGQGEGCARGLGPTGIGVQNFPGCLFGLSETLVQGAPVALAFHGNLFNTTELFPTKNDKDSLLQALLHLYIQEKTAFLHRLRGEFAFALWDGVKESLYLVTDRFRIHPLFYYQDNEKFVFASRMQGILACPSKVDRTISHEAIVDVMASSIIPTPRTIFQEIKKLPPGHILSYEKGNIKLTPYWGMNFLQASSAGESVLTRELRTRFADSMSIRLAHDVATDRIGTFVSGGIDSSTVTGVLTQLTGKPTKSFSIGFDEQYYNELEYARVAARAFGSEHYEYIVTPQDVCDAIPIVLRGFDEPFANSSAIPMYFCAKIAKEHGVETVYVGDGGDELFAGNERYAAQRLFDYYYNIPAGLRKNVLQPLVFFVADRLGINIFNKGKKYIQRATTPYPERLGAHHLFELIPMRDLFEDDLLESVGNSYNPLETMYLHYFQARARTELDKQLHIDLKLAIADNDLFKVTRMAEAAGVTVRFPFLDHLLAEFAATVPADIKMRRRQLRSFFKKAYSDLLPRDIRKKKKHGFGLPIPVWLRSNKQLNEMMRDLLLGSRSTLQAFCRKKTLEILVDLHKTDTTSFYGTILWNAVILELWLRSLGQPGVPESTHNTVATNIPHQLA